MGRPEVWSLVCDHVTCSAVVAEAAPYDELAARRAIARARAEGWQVGGDARPDLCPEHAARAELEVS